MEKICTICGNIFETIYQRQNVCSFGCARKRNNDNALDAIHRRKNPEVKYRCEACGYDKVVENHHEGGRKYKLCPNCHALITRKGAKIAELLTIVDSEKAQ